MGWLILLAAFGTGFLSFLVIFQISFHTRLRLAERLEVFTRSQGPKNFDEEKLSKSFAERVVKPIIVRLAEQMSRLIPTKKSTSLQKRLLMAGNPGGLTHGEFIVIEYSLIVGLALLGLFLTLPADMEIIVVVMATLGGGAMGYILPGFYLQAKATQRQEEIQKTLPDVLDLLTVSVEAGLGFDAALVKVVEKTKGVLAEEFNRMLQEIKMGKPRREALRDLGQNLGNEDLQSFVGALIQADQLGISIGNVLRLQSEQMRSKRRQKAEEKAMKAPIKMLIPMVLFIFPTIFIVLMGPAVIQVINTMK